MVFRSVYIVIPIVFLLCVNNVSAQKVDLTFAKDTKARFTELKKSYTLNADGSETFHYSHKLKFDSSGVSAFEVKISYNAEYQSIRIVKSQVTDKANISRTIIPFGPDSSLGSGYRIYFLAFKSTEIPGYSCHELEFEIVTKKGFMPGFMHKIVLKEQFPVDSMRIRIEFPQDQKLYYNLVNSARQPEISDAGAYQWNFSSVKTIKKEEYSPDLEDFEPVLVFSNKATMEPISKFVLAKSAFKFQVSEATRKWIMDLKKSSKNEFELIRRIHEFVLENIKTEEIDFDLTGCHFHNTDQVLKFKTACEIDKTILFTALLSSAGIRCEPVLIAPLSVFSTPFGCFSAFDKVLVRIRTFSGFTFYLSVNQLSDYSLGYQVSKHWLLPLNPLLPGIEKTDGIDDHASINQYYKLKVSKSLSVSGSISSACERLFFPVFKFVNDTSGVINEIVPGAEFMSRQIDSTSPMYLKFSGDIILSKNLNSLGKEIKLDLPKSATGTFRTFPSEFDSVRNNPFFLPLTICEKYQYVVKIPPKYTLAEKKSKVINNQFGEYNCTCRGSGRKFTISIYVFARLQTINPDEFKSFTKLWKEWTNPDNFTLKLVPKK